jgi:hypothetical protein
MADTVDARRTRSGNQIEPKVVWIERELVSQVLHPQVVAKQFAGDYSEKMVFMDSQPLNGRPISYRGTRE